jgi:hypothetical protein
MPRGSAPGERAAAKAAPYCHANLANVELTAAVQVEQPIFSMLDAEERQQLRVIFERRLGSVPVRLEDGPITPHQPPIIICLTLHMLHRPSVTLDARR